MTAALGDGDELNRGWMRAPAAVFFDEVRAGAMRGNPTQQLGLCPFLFRLPEQIMRRFFEAAQCAPLPLLRPPVADTVL